MKHYEVIIRLLLAVFIGGFIGYERSFKNRPAGFRTHILVCVGATIIAIIQVYSAYEVLSLIEQNPLYSSAIRADTGRLVAQVVSGIGFLGAGTILHQKGSVKGLTTAASLWVVGCLGIAVGMGYYFLSIVAALSVFIVLWGLTIVEEKYMFKDKTISIAVTYVNADIVKVVSKVFRAKDITIQNIVFSNEEHESCCVFTVVVPRQVETGAFIYDITKIKGITKVELL